MTVDYRRLDYERQQHHRRFVAYVARHGLSCQDCGGMGSYVEEIDPWIGGPCYDCGWCEGTGRTTRHLRGLWLRFKRDEQHTRTKKAKTA